MIYSLTSIKRTATTCYLDFEGNIITRPYWVDKKEYYINHFEKSTSEGIKVLMKYNKMSDLYLSIVEDYIPKEKLLCNIISEDGPKWIVSIMEAYYILKNI